MACVAGVVEAIVLRLFLLVAVSLVAVPVILAPSAAAWPPVCIVKEVGGEEGGKLYAEVWVTCGPRATVTTCPKDGFCKTVSTDDLVGAGSSSAGNCYHMMSGYGWDRWLCVDAKGPVGCKVYTETTWWEQGTTRSCIA